MPVAGLICVIYILMISRCRTVVSTAVANFIAIGCVDMIQGVELLAASYTDFPMPVFIVELLSGTLVSGFHYISAGLTGLCATVGEGMLCMADPAGAIAAACPVVQIIMLPVIADGMLGSGLLAAGVAYLLVGFQVNVRIAAVDMFSGSVNDLCCLTTAIGTYQLTAAAVNTGSFLDQLAIFPVVLFALLEIAFAANSDMLAFTAAFPLVKAVITRVLDTGLAIALCNFVSGVRFLFTFAADLVFLVRVCGFDLRLVIMAAACVGRAAAGIIGGAEVEVTDLTLADHDTVSVVAVSTGIALQRVEVSTFRVINKTNMAEVFLEKQIALLRCIAFAVLIRQAEVTGVGQTGSFQYTFGNACFLGAPAYKHATPGGIGLAVPFAILGVIVAAFPVTDLGQRHTDNIIAHVAGVFVCVFICGAYRRSEERNH